MRPPAVLTPASLLAFGIAAACGEAATPEVVAGHVFHGIERHDAPEVADVALTDQRGRAFRLSEQRGRPVLVFFGFVQCPDVCPTALSTWVAVERELGEAARDVTFAFVTVDPERDTPERLAKHLAVFSPSFLGLCGTRDELEAAYHAFGVEATRVPLEGGGEGAYLIDHSTRMFLLDRAGRLRAEYDFRARARDVVADVRWVLES